MKREATIYFNIPRKNLKGDFTGELINDTMKADFIPLYETDANGSEILLCYEGNFFWKRTDPMFDMEVDAIMYANKKKEIVAFVSALHSIPLEAVSLFKALGFTISKQIDLIRKNNVNI